MSVSFILILFLLVLGTKMNHCAMYDSYVAQTKTTGIMPFMDKQGPNLCPNHLVLYVVS